MLRFGKITKCALVTILLLGSLVAAKQGNIVYAAAGPNSSRQELATDTLTPTFTPSLTLTFTPTFSPSRTLTFTPTFTATYKIIHTRTYTPSRTFTVSPTLTHTPTRTPTVTGTRPTPTSTPPALQHIVISEFRTLGPLGINDEFIELYNPTGAPVDIGTWSISASSACGTSLYTLMYIYYGTMLQPGQHYLVAAYASYSSIAIADQRFSPGIPDAGGIALVSSGTVVDMVGMCPTTYFYEGTPLAPLPDPVGSSQSYERKAGGETACYDTNNNITDFSLISPADPRTQTDQRVTCSGLRFPGTLFIPFVDRYFNGQ